MNNMEGEILSMDGQATDVRTGIPSPGFSDRVRDPEILAALQKQKKMSARFALFLVPLPLVGFVIYALISKEMELVNGVIIGTVVSAVFLLFYLFNARREREENTYDAVVKDQKTREYTRKNSRARHGRDKWITEYITIAETDSGKKKKIVERDGQRLWAWDYLDVGDRFRYHPQFAFPYELYDKSQADCLYCVICQTRNSVEADRCNKCGVPLLK